MDSDSRKNPRFNILGAQYPLPLIEAGSKTKEQILVEGTVLFAKKGYAAVSMRDLAEAIGIKPASLYNHFDSKEALWEAVLEQAFDLYTLYFRQLGEAIDQAETFQDVLELIFLEPKQWANEFTCYAFSVVQSEQFRDERASRIFNETFLSFSINFISDRFNRCIERGLAPKFDTGTIAAIIMHSVLIGINIKVHELMGRPLPYDHYQMMGDLQQFILWSLNLGADPK